MTSQISTIESLPSEILDSVLATFPTTSLLSLSLVSHRFHAIITRLLYRRLRHAVALSNYQLLLECYHPSERTLTPVLSCEYLGTDGLDEYPSSGHVNYVDSDNIHALLGLYSRFHPVPKEDMLSHYKEARRREVSPLHSPAHSPSHSPIHSPAHSDDEEDEDYETPATSGASTPRQAYQDVELDEGELFSQMCAVTHLMRAGPQKGCYFSCCTINNSVIRVWRDWLARCEHGQAGFTCCKDVKSTDGPSFQTYGNDTAVLWAGVDRQVGLRFRVKEREVHEDRFASGLPEEDLPVSYTLEYEELLVRTCRLLLAVEKAESQEDVYCL